MGTRIGLVLTGGGARGAYQAGVLKGLTEILEDVKDCKLDVFSGISAGSINAAHCAAHVDDLLQSSKELCKIWEGLTSEDVYRSDVTSLSQIGLRWLSSVTIGGLMKKRPANALLDTSPLRKLLNQHINFELIRKNKQNGSLRAVACSTFNYNESQTVIFVEGSSEIKHWESQRRRSAMVELNADHVMASCAIPMLFPPIPINKEFYGDGSLRNTAPIGPVINLGAEKIIVVGVRNASMMKQAQPSPQGPSIARIFGLMLNSLFFDTIDIDIERMGHINGILHNAQIRNPQYVPFRPVEYLWLKPSVDLGRLAEQESKSLPPLIRYLMGGLGNRHDASELASYLLFETRYTKQLVKIGYMDCISQKDELLKFLQNK